MMLWRERVGKLRREDRGIEAGKDRGIEKGKDREIEKGKDRGIEKRKGLPILSRDQQSMKCMLLVSTPPLLCSAPLPLQITSKQSLNL